MNTPIGLRERIANAATEAEIVELLVSGQTFNYASPRTRLSWKYTAQRRTKQLQKTVATVTTADSSPVGNKKKTGNKKITNKK